MLVATLVSATGGSLVDAPLIARLSREVAGITGSAMLESGIAADLFAEGAQPRKLEADLRIALGEATIDLIVQPVATRRKALFLAIWIRR